MTIQEGEKLPGEEMEEREDRNVAVWDLPIEYTKKEGFSKISELPLELQPREKAMKYGINSLTTAELWAIVLRTGVQGLPVTELSKTMMENVGNRLTELASRAEDIGFLMRLPGVGVTKGIQIQAVLELAKLFHDERLESPSTIYDSAKDSAGVYKYMLKVPGVFAKEERIWILILDRALRIRKHICVSQGGESSTIFDLKKILQKLIVERAYGVIMCHNHPSGALYPSGPDDEITRRLKEGVKVIDVRLLNHVIVTSAGYYSYADNGRL